jgi:hypothetical protein
MRYVVAMLGAMLAAGWTGTVISGDQDQVRLRLQDGSCLEEELLVGGYSEEELLVEDYGTRQPTKDKDKDLIHKGPDVTTMYEGPACGECPKVP